MSDLQEFECSICVRIFEEPMRTECNHVFCKSCLKRAGADCAICREKIAHGSTQRALDLIKRMETNQTECPTCKQKMKIKDLRIHDETAHPNPQIHRDVRPKRTARRSPRDSGMATRRSPRVVMYRDEYEFDFGQESVLCTPDLDVDTVGNGSNLAQRRAEQSFGSVDPSDFVSNQHYVRSESGRHAVNPRRAVRTLRSFPTAGDPIAPLPPNPMELHQHPRRRRTIPGLVEPVAYDIATGDAAMSSRGRSRSERNWYLFECPYGCRAVNLDRDGLLTHCNSTHAQDPNQSRVCTICIALPYGNENQRSGNLIQHLNLRHKADLDMYTDFSLDDDQAMIKTVQRSVQDF